MFDAGTSSIEVVDAVSAQCDIAPCVGSYGESHSFNEATSKNLSPGWRSSKIITPNRASIESIVPGAIVTEGSIPELIPKTSSQDSCVSSDFYHKASTSSRFRHKSSVIAAEKSMFADPAAMKARLRQTTMVKIYDVKDFYKEEGICRAIATNVYFEALTLSVITFNALWMWIDTDYNNDVLWKAPAVFQVVEHCLCAFYSFEWFIRFCSFKEKRDGLKDAWFVFDTILIVLTVLETWVMNFIMMSLNSGAESGMGNTFILRMARLLRLSRMARMARLFRVMPEVMIMLKGMVAACRSVLFTMALLVIVIYVFAIAFTQLTSESDMGQEYFRTVPKSMVTLLLFGTLLDRIGEVTYNIAEEDIIYAALFLVFVVLTSLTVMNMLIGVLCEVVSAVATVEREQMVVNFVKDKMEEILSSGIDKNDDRMISKDEFVCLLENEKATACLHDVGVDVFGLVDHADFIFEEDHFSGEGRAEEKELNFTDFMEAVLQQRGKNQATVKDAVDLRKYIRNKHKEVFKILSEKDKTWRSTTKIIESACTTGTITEGSDEHDHACDNQVGIVSSHDAPPMVHPLSHREQDHSRCLLEHNQGADPESTPELHNETLHKRVENLKRLIDDGSRSLRELRERRKNVEKILGDASSELSSLREVMQRRGQIY